MHCIGDPEKWLCWIVGVAIDAWTRTHSFDWRQLLFGHSYIENTTRVCVDTRDGRVRVVYAVHATPPFIASRAVRWTRCGGVNSTPYIDALLAISCLL